MHNVCNIFVNIGMQILCVDLQPGGERKQRKETEDDHSASSFTLFAFLLHALLHLIALQLKRRAAAVVWLRLWWLWLY